MKKRKQLIFDVTNNGWLAGKGHVSVKSVTSWFSWGWLNKQHCQSNKTAVKVSPHLSQKKQQEKTHLHIATPSPTETSLCKQERSHIQFVIQARYGSVTWPPPSLLSTYCIDKSMPKMNGPNTMVLPSHGSLESASWPLFCPTRNDSFHLKWNFSSGFVYLQGFLPFLCNNFGCIHCFAAPWSLHDSCKESGSCEGHWPEWLSRSYQHWTIWMPVGISCSLSCLGRKATQLGPWVTR